MKDMKELSLTIMMLILSVIAGFMNIWFIGSDPLMGIILIMAVTSYIMYRSEEKKLEKKMKEEVKSK